MKRFFVYRDIQQLMSQCAIGCEDYVVASFLENIVQRIEDSQSLSQVMEEQPVIPQADALYRWWLVKLSEDTEKLAEAEQCFKSQLAEISSHVRRIQMSRLMMIKDVLDGMCDTSVAIEYRGIYGRIHYADDLIDYKRLFAKCFQAWLEKSPPAIDRALEVALSCYDLCSETNIWCIVGAIWGSPDRFYVRNNCLFIK